MSDGCRHIPAENLDGYDVHSFVTGPRSGPAACAITPNCDSSHVFEVRNFHLYNVEVQVNGSSGAKEVEVCDNSKDVSERNLWTMTGTVPAAPYRRRRREDPYGKRRLNTYVRSTAYMPNTQDVIVVDYSINSPVQGLMLGMNFNVPVNLA